MTDIYKLKLLLPIFITFIAIPNIAYYGNVNNWNQNSILTLNNHHTTCIYDASNNFTTLVKERGYRYEEHDIITSDNYILKLFRILPKKFFEKPKRKVVFLLHGLMDSSDAWVINTDDRSVAYRFLNMGYDVWLGNTRGNKYSSRHLFKQPTIKDFWDFSFQEMGMYDIPAMVKFVQKKTSQKKLIFVAHSQATLAMISAMADPITSKKVQSKVSKFIALSPVLTLGQIKSKWITWFTLLTERLIGQEQNYALKFINSYILPWQFAPANCAWTYKSQQKIFQWALTNFHSSFEIFYRLTTDIDSKYDDLDIMKVYLRHYPSGTSMKNQHHLVQMIRQEGGVVRKYDYGEVMNYQKYGIKEPPSYDFSLINIPCSFYLGMQDMLETEDGLDIAVGRIYNSKKVKVKYLENWGHVTFFVGKRMDAVSQSLLDDAENF